ncbi:MAG: glycosyltransferase [Lachnospiraceae bacterium]|nr:glycosyltransferase [Lachnospiraceae bacterium]
MIDNQKKIITVIVTYNRINLLKECITAILSSTVVPDILVVNNASTDGTKEYLDEIIKNNKNIFAQHMDTNLNGAGGYNYGLKAASKKDYDYIWLMDDDTIVNNDSLEQLLNVANELNDDFGFLSSKVLWLDGSICKTNVQRKKVARKIRDFNSKLVNVDFASFVSLFVKRNDVLKVGLPIKEFIIWTDDLEWTRRLTLKRINPDAKKGYLCNDSIVTHKCKNNFGVTIVKDTSDRLDRYEYIYRNDVVCFRREGIRGHLFMLVRNAYHIIRVLLFSKNNKFKKIKTIVKGYIDGYKFYPQIEFV